jgi:hypothetical protein
VNPPRLILFRKLASVSLIPIQSLNLRAKDSTPSRCRCVLPAATARAGGFVTTAPVSLYLDLEKGEVADLEVVARTALAFSAAIKELAFILEPGAEVRVELVSGTEGSLSLNSIVRSIRGVATKDRLITIGTMFLFYIVAETRDYTFGKVLDHFFDKDAPEAERRLSDEDIERIRKAIEAGAAKKEVQQIYREAERDPSIKGLGASLVPGERPPVIVPRSEFRERAGIVIQETTERKRVVPQPMTVVLVSPVLQEGTRRWRLLGPQGEFGASVKDKEFTQRVLSGTTPVPMVAGIMMDIDLEVHEDFEGGVWVPKERVVAHVKDVRPPSPLQSPLPFSSGPRQEGDDED